MSGEIFINNIEICNSSFLKRVQNQDYHKMPLGELKTTLQTNFDRGLNSNQVKQFSHTYGENKMYLKKNQTQILSQILKYQAYGFNLLSWACVILCFGVYGYYESDISQIYIVVLIMIQIFLISFVMSRQDIANDLISSKSQNQVSTCTVRRDNVDMNVDTTDLAIGDIIYLIPSMKIPADIRIINSQNLRVDNSKLTGESETVIRSNEESQKESLIESENMLFEGNYIVEGEGKGLVTATGKYTLMSSFLTLAVDDNQQQAQNLNSFLKSMNKFLIVAIIACIIIIILSIYVIELSIEDSIILGVSACISLIPVNLILNYKISINLLIENLFKKNIVIKNREVLDKIGSIDTICLAKTGAITQNKMRVSHLYYNNNVYSNKGVITFDYSKVEVYQPQNSGFDNLKKCALINSSAFFDNNQLMVKDGVIDYENTPVIGDKCETGLIRFFQEIEDVQKFRESHQIAEDINQSKAQIPFTATYKMNLTIIEEKTENSYYTAILKGAPERIWSCCSYLVIDNQESEIDEIQKEQFHSVLKLFENHGERIFGFATLNLPKNQFPRGYPFSLKSMDNLPFELKNFQFCGLISFSDPPKEEAQQTFECLNTLGIKSLMLTGDLHITSCNIARQVNIVGRNISSNDENKEDKYCLLSNINSINNQKSQILYTTGHHLNKKNVEEETQFLNYLLQNNCNIFARVLPSQKKDVVTACQANGSIVAAVGEGMQDLPMLKQSDISIAISQSNNNALQDNSDILLLNNKINSLLDIIKEGKIMQTNMKKSISFTLSQNIIIVFLIFFIFKIPFMLSGFQIIVISIILNTTSTIILPYFKQDLIKFSMKDKFKWQNTKISSNLIFTSLLQLAFISFMGGLTGYFVTFNYYGFPVLSLFGLAKVQGYISPLNDFQPHFNPYINQFDAFFNENLYKISSDCRLNTQESDKLKYDLDWFNLKGEGNRDLRKSLIKCDEISGRWVNDIEWSNCDIEDNISQINNSSVCYSTEAINYAQSSFFVCMFLVSFIKIFTSCDFTSQKLHYYKILPFYLIILVFQVILVVILLYAPYFQDKLGGRPIHFYMFGLPSVPFCLTLSIFEETRKYLMKKQQWFGKFTSY